MLSTASALGSGRAFAARGRWRERLPMILDTLAALGRARLVAGDTARWAAA